MNGTFRGTYGAVIAIDGATIAAYGVTIATNGVTIAAYGIIVAVNGVFEVIIWKGLFQIGMVCKAVGFLKCQVRNMLTRISVWEFRVWEGGLEGQASSNLGFHLPNSLTA